MAVADFVVIGIVILCTLVGLALGVTRVVLGLCGWAGAVIAAIYGFPYTRPVARDLIEMPILADIAAAVTVFVAALIALTAISHLIGERVSASGFGALNRSLGLMTGLVIGALVVSGSFLVIERSLELPRDPGGWPPWLRDARTAPLVDYGAGVLNDLLPPAWRHSGREQAQGLTKKEREEQLRQLLVPKRKVSPEDAKSGYNRRERLEMDRLFQSHGQGQE